MMEGVLKFNLDDPADRHAHLLAVNAARMRSALWNLNESIWSTLKYGDPGKQVINELEKLHSIITEDVGDLLED
jgi:hypothetical protein